MKKIMAIVLVAAMILAIMPAAFATSKTVMDPREAVKGADLLSQNDAFADRSLQYGRTHRGQTTLNPESIDKKYQSISRTKGWADDLNGHGVGVAPIDPERAATSGYWFLEETDTEAGFVLMSESVIFDGDEYGLLVVPAEGQAAYSYAKNELMYFNFDIYQAFDQTAEQLISLPEKEDGYGVGALVYAGPAAEDTIPLIGMYSSMQGGLSIEYVTPDDDYNYMIVLFVEKVDEFSQGWGGWFTLSTADGVVRDLKVGEDMKVGEELTQEISSSDKLCAVPMNESFIPEYGQVHKIELEGGKKYFLVFDSDEAEIYGHLLFATANMDIMCETAVVNDDEHNIMRVFPTESGTYYVGCCGFDMLTEGTVKIKVVEWEEVSPDVYPDVDEVIDLGSIGKEPQVGQVEGIDVWAYSYNTQNNYGVLAVGGLAGTYTIQGDAQDIVVVALDGSKVVLDNASINSVILDNYYAPVSISAKGSAKISCPDGMAIVNDEGYLSGVYLTGDELTIEGIFGIYLESAPITLAAKKLIVDTTSMEGYYPIAMWVMGNNIPSVALGSNAKFDNNNRITKMCYDPDGYFTTGYAVSEHAELNRADDPGWSAAVLYFELTTDGLGGDTGAALVGDANGDGKVNTGDATTVLKYAAGMIPEGSSLINLANADTNGDSKVNTGDATMILKYAAGMITEFPVH